MYNDPYADDLTDPFASSGDQYDEEWTPAQPRRGVHVSSKVWAGVLIVAVVVAAAAGVYWLVRQVAGSPVDTVRNFYDSVNRRDFDAAAALIDPQAGISSGLLANAESVAGVLFEIVGDEVLSELGVDDGGLISSLLGDLEWQFRDMNYALQGQAGDQATVQASGELFLSAFGFDLPVPWSLSHTVVRRDGRWYLSFDY